MKKFTFKLETLLRHRESLEETERMKMSRIHLRLQSELNLIRELKAKHYETLVELAAVRSKNEDVRESAWFFAYLDRLSTEMQQCNQRIVGLEKEIREQQRVVVEASKNKKIIDTLKTQKKQEHLEEREKEEQKEIDELIVTRFQHGS